MRERSTRMSDDADNAEVIDVQGLSSAHLAALGDSALGHAVHRLLTVSDNATTDNEATIAAFQSHI
jgi:hypothetical protein